MLAVLENRTFRHLYVAQIVALIGTGLATIALGLLAFELAGDRAGAVLGTALAIKMVAYVSIAPVAAALLAGLPRRPVLVSLDLIRAAVAVLLPFVSEIWQVYVLIFVLQAASAAFTPTFQATIPDILPDETEYTRALSLSRVAYDLESVISPMLAAALLLVMSFNVLFAGTVVGFLLSAALVLTVTLPIAQPVTAGNLRERTFRGVNIFLKTPRLRGLLAVDLAVAMAGAVVIVNTVVYVQGEFDLSQRATALALGVFGTGSLIAALALPTLLDRISDRIPMLAGAGLVAIATIAVSRVTSYEGLLLLWLIIGFGYSIAQTPSGRLLRRSSHEDNRPAVFAAHFALSHLCWLAAYPIAGWAVQALGLSGTAAMMGIIGLFATIVAVRVWPTNDPIEIPHAHPDLGRDHPHVMGYREHSHAYTIDDLHSSWPR